MATVEGLSLAASRLKEMVRIEQGAVSVVFGFLGVILGTPLIIWVKMLVEQHLTRLHRERQIREPHKYVKPVAWWYDGPDDTYYVRMFNRNHFKVSIEGFSIVFIKSRRATKAEFIRRIYRLLRFKHRRLRRWNSIADHDSWLSRTLESKHAVRARYRGERIVMEPDEVCTVYLTVRDRLTPFNSSAFLSSARILAGSAYFGR